MGCVRFAGDPNPEFELELQPEPGNVEPVRRNTGIGIALPLCLCLLLHADLLQSVCAYPISKSPTILGPALCVMQTYLLNKFVLEQKADGACIMDWLPVLVPGHCDLVLLPTDCPRVTSD